MSTTDRLRTVLFCACLVFAQGLPAATFYVAKTGSDLNPGSAAQPFLTVKRGLEAAQPGDVVRLGEGRYEETVATARAGASGQYITLDGQGVASVIKVNLAHAYQQVVNLTVTGQVRTYSEQVLLGRNSHYAILSNLVVLVTATNVSGISWQAPSTKPFGADAASNCVVRSNRVTGVVAATGLNIYGENNLIAGNYVHDLGQSDFVRLWGRNNLVRANTFTNIFSVPGLGNHIDFVQTFGDLGFGSSGHVIEQNKVIQVAGQLTQLESDVMPEIGDWTFRNNLFIDVAMQASCTIPNVKYFNNVFYRCNQFNGGHALNFGKRAYTDVGTSYAHGAQVLNNVFVDCGNEYLNRGWYSIGTDLTNVVANHNFVTKNNYSTVKAGTKPVGSGAHDNFAFYEPNGINGGNPEFFSETALDFRPRSGSRLIDAGTAISGLANDLAGTRRPQGRGIDIGAFEYTGEASPTPQPPLALRLAGD